MTVKEIVERRQFLSRTGAEVVCGDAVEVLRTIPENYYDACLTDPPYGLTKGKRGGTGAASVNLNSPAGRSRIGTGNGPGGFMGLGWDAGVPPVGVWREVCRVLKPGAMMLAFGGTRTHHRLMCAIEDAGFEIRDCLMWLHSQGFAKSLNIGKALDKVAGAERPVVGKRMMHTPTKNGNYDDDAYVWGDKYQPVTGPTTDAAKIWDGWGTALKPALEIIVAAQKPHDMWSLCAILVHRIADTVCQLPLLVRDAEKISEFSPRELQMVEPADSALWPAVQRCNTLEDLFALMDMLPSESALPFILSTAFSWLNTLAALSEHGSMFTTEMGSSLTTDLKILNSLRWPNTPADLIAGVSGILGTGSNAALVESLLCGARARLGFTLTRSAQELATLGEVALGLHPDWEPIALAMKPCEGTFAENALKWGVAGLNIDGCRIPSTGGRRREGEPSQGRRYTERGGTNLAALPGPRGGDPGGRWPANMILDEEAAEMLDEQSGELKSGANPTRRGSDKFRNTYNTFVGQRECVAHRGADSGSASRFYYVAKASRAERGEGNDHPTVKPLKLCEYLARLLLPPQRDTPRRLLVPFSGSGSEMIGALRTGWERVVGIDNNAEYCELARRRIQAAVTSGGTPAPASPPPG